MFDHRSISRLACLAATTAGLWLAATKSPQAQGRPFDLRSATISEIQAAVDRGSLTYERLVGLYLARVEAYDRAGPRLNAVRVVNPMALDQARELDAERRVRGRRGPLHGIPVAVKDNIDVAGLPTTGGNLAFDGVPTRADATIIGRLRDAGAIVLLKTNMDEFALGTRGLSSLGGQVLNAFDLTRSPGGSSGGTAVAVAAGLASVGLATETGISTRGPAANLGLVGLVPSRGLFSRAGVMPVSFTQDRIGIHARSVADAAAVLGVLGGFDADDLSTTAPLYQSSPISPASPPPSPLRQARLGVLRDLFRAGDEFAEGNRLVTAQIERLRGHGATIVGDLSSGLDLLALMPTLRVNNDELRTAFDGYLRRRGAPAPVSLAALVATGRFLEGTGLGARFTTILAAPRPDQHPEYLARLAAQRRVRDALIGLMDRERLDALVYPVKSLPAPPLGTGDDGPRDNNISATAGLPAVVLPAGLTASGLPIAIEVLGRPYSETTLLGVAVAIEQINPSRPIPPLTPALPGDVLPD